MYPQPPPGILIALTRRDAHLAPCRTHGLHATGDMPHDFGHQNLEWQFPDDKRADPEDIYGEGTR